MATLVYQLAYDADSDCEFLIETGLFICYTKDPKEIIARANELWGKDWFGLSYQDWDCNDLDVESTTLFNKEAA